MGADLEEAESKIATVLTSLEGKLCRAYLAIHHLRLSGGHLKKTYGLGVLQPPGLLRFGSGCRKMLCKGGALLTVKSLIASLESAPVGDGDLLGQPFKCLPYQRRFLRGAFRPGVMRAGLSVARGAGKTGLASALALDSVRPGGALHRAGGETVLIASSFAQAKIAFEAVKTSLEKMGEDGEYRIRDQQNLADIQHRDTKARLRVLVRTTGGRTGGASTWRCAMSPANGDRVVSAGGGDTDGPGKAEGGAGGVHWDGRPVIPISSRVSWLKLIRLCSHWCMPPGPMMIRTRWRRGGGLIRGCPLACLTLRFYVLRHGWHGVILPSWPRSRRCG